MASAVCPLSLLSRYGGLRCPSENLALRWSDVDWERGRLRVPSPKTEHHPGPWPSNYPNLPRTAILPGGRVRSGRTRDRIRDCPLSQCERQPSNPIGADHHTCGPRTLAETLPKSSTPPGRRSWPNRSPSSLHVACAWLGNTQTVAARHYLQVTDEHFQQASMAPGDEECEQSGPQRGHAASRSKPSVVVPAKKETPENRHIAETAR